jgi:mannose-6-phosphate isomerase class I
VRAALEGNADVSQMMHFVPVQPGDFFVIEAGTPHAIGAGVTLVEPQRIIAGSSGVTYRYWDWGRRYDSAGGPSVDGKARELHVDHAIAVTDWARVTDRAFVDTIRRRASAPNLDGPATVTVLAEHPSGLQPHLSPSDAGSPPPLTAADLQVARLEGTGACTLPAWTSVTMGLTVLEGSVQFAHGEVVHRGETAALPEGAAGLPVTLSGAHALLMTARPA